MPLAAVSRPLRVSFCAFGCNSGHHSRIAISALVGIAIRNWRAQPQFVRSLPFATCGPSVGIAAMNLSQPATMTLPRPKLPPLLEATACDAPVQGYSLLCFLKSPSEGVESCRSLVPLVSTIVATMAQCYILGLIVVPFCIGV